MGWSQLWIPVNQGALIHGRLDGCYASSAFELVCIQMVIMDRLD
jgi:hypothetical protein